MPRKPSPPPSGLLRTLTLAIAAAVTCGTLAPPSAAADAPPARLPWTIPGVLRIGTTANPRTLNTILVTGNDEISLTRLTNDVLLTADARGELVPSLAAEVPSRANGGISADQRTITYRLRRNVKWHDGAPFTSADVAFTFRAIMDPRNNVTARDGYDRVERVTTPDPYTVVFRFRQPYAPALGTIFSESGTPLGILPAHLLAKLPTINDIPYNAAPVGTGPFRLVRWIRGDRIEYEANPSYFRGAPKLKRIVVAIVPDENTLVNRLRAHEIDWVFEASLTAYRDLRRIPHVRAQLTPTNGWNGFRVNNAHPPLDDARVRRAIALAVDRAALAQVLTEGAMRPANADFPPFLWAHDPTIPPARRDLAAANALLDAAGLARGADGMRTYQGAAYALDVVYDPATPLWRREAVMLQAQLREVGLDVKPRAVVRSLLFAPAAAGGVMRTGHFDLGITDRTDGVDPDNAALFTCAAIASADNEEHYCSRDMDAAQAAALGTFDRAARTRAYRRIERDIVANAPVVPIFWYGWVEGLSDDVRGVGPNPATEMWNAWEWSI